MYVTKEQRVKELELRISKLEASPTSNERLVKKAQRQIRKLTK